MHKAEGVKQDLLQQSERLAELKMASASKVKGLETYMGLEVGLEVGLLVGLFWVGKLAVKGGEPRSGR